NSTGALSGDMDILVGGDLTVVGGSDATAYGLLGHGGHNSTSGGSRVGALDIGVQGTTTLTDAAALATLGHVTSTAGAVSASSFHLTTGMLDTAANAAGVTGLIERMAPGGEFEIAVTNGDLTVDGAGAFFQSNAAVDLAATGGVSFEAAVLNGGGGDVNAVAGWDGSTGLVSTIDFNSCEPITELRIDIADIEADSDAFGNNDEEVVVGDGNQTAPIAVGSAGGETNVLGYGVNLTGSDFTAGGLAQIGFNEELFRAETGNDGVGSSGDINILAKEGGLTLTGGSQSNASAHVGHGGNGTIAPLGGDISVDLTHGDEDGDLALTGGSGSGANSFAKLGHGGNNSIGAKSGDIDVTAGEVNLRGGVANFTSASIGHGGGGGVGDLSGAIDVEATDEGVVMRAGDGASSGVQIGHGGVNYNGSATAQPVTVDSAGVVTMVGGSGVNSATQIGHGGVNATATELSGNVDVTAAGDIYLLGGTEVNASTQIGHGGNSADGDFGGDVTVDSGSNITLASNGTTGASAKIGHGDDLSSPALSGTGEREGDIEVSAGADITMTDAMIGHVNSATNATATGGSTQIGAARTDPTDPTAGSVIADADSEFQGEDELRFYVPRRANNQVAAGALLNGVSFVGAETDPSETQRIDEFTINILGDRILFPNEHANAFGTGPAPQNAGNFAFYYDTILLEDLPPLPPVQPEPPLPPVPLTDSLFSLLFPDDRTTDDWRREQEEEFSGFNPWGVYYEGFDQYGLYGESIFSTGSGNTLELE
ncbi:MAG: hypothetical protein MI807_03860, partial [Verrucomicrobiales bacterium]|nr:hypothetical protein [Verrucomicrobiales bacterium]